MQEGRRMMCEVCASHGKKVRSFDVVKLLTFLLITQFHISKVQTKSHRIIWAHSIFRRGKSQLDNQSLHGRCRRHQMIVASYAAASLEAAKWLGKIWIYKNASLQVCDMLHNVPCITARNYMCIFPTQPFTFPRFANSDRWFAIPIGMAAQLATII